MWVWEAFYLEDPCELTFANTLLLSNAAISLGNAFINLEISSEYIIFFTLWSFFLSSLFISLQIKEFRILALSINDSLYSSLFFFLTGLHFFHLSIGLILLIYFWSSVSAGHRFGLSSFAPQLLPASASRHSRFLHPPTSSGSCPRVAAPPGEGHAPGGRMSEGGTECSEDSDSKAKIPRP